MKKTVRALKAGLKGAIAAYGPGEYKAAGAIVVCPHCQGRMFQEREALLNTTGATLLNLDWLNTSGVALVCETCALIQWFGKRPEKV